MQKKEYDFKVYLGKIKDTSTNVYLTGFKWDCDWYWGGGYIETRNLHAHFDGCFLKPVDERGHSLGNFVSPWHKEDFPGSSKVVSNGCSVWEDLDFFLDDAQFSNKEWWRIKDLFKQFYIYKDAAEAFRLCGHCTSANRSEAEINPDMEKYMNTHIETVIIPEILKSLKVL